jgi:ribosomal protein S5
MVQPSDKNNGIFVKKTATLSLKKKPLLSYINSNHKRLVNVLPVTAKSLFDNCLNPFDVNEFKAYLTLVNTSQVSRTVEGGRRRRYLVNGIRTGVGPYLSYVVPVKSKALERFMAIEKLRVTEIPSIVKPKSISNYAKKNKFFTDSFKLHGYSIAKRSIKNAVRSHYIPEYYKFKGGDCFFIPPVSSLKLPGRTFVEKTDSTFTVFKESNKGLDICAEPIQYNFLKSIGMTHVLAKNHGAKHKVSRIMNLIKVFSSIEFDRDIGRRRGVKL